MPRQPTTAELLHFGFRQLGQWEMLHDKIKARLTDQAEGAGWIYAFATGERVRYFGISNRVIRSRFDEYRNQINDTIALRIQKVLIDGDTVSIFGVCSREHEISDLKAQESHLITIFGTDWNVHP
jgi:hypothetical protein